MTSKPSISFNAPCLSSEDIVAAQNVLSSGWIAEGSCSVKLQNAINHMLGEGSSRVTTSGTAALFLALKFLALPPQSKIAVPTYSCTALLDAVHLAGYVPVIIDSDSSTPNIDLNAIADNPFGQKPNAVIGVHTFGIPISAQQIRQSPIPFIEDCCHSIGGNSEGYSIGSLGDVSIFSFYATKIITGGIGGLVYSKRHDMIEAIDHYLNPSWGQDSDPQFNFRISDINTSLILSQLGRISDIRKRRQSIYDTYLNALPDIAFALHVRKDDIMPYRFVLLADDRRHQTNLEQYFLNHGIGVSTLYKPEELLHNRLGFNKTLFPNAENLATRTLALPLHLNLSDAHITFIAKKIRSMPAQ